MDEIITMDQRLSGKVVRGCQVRLSEVVRGCQRDNSVTTLANLVRLFMIFLVVRELLVKLGLKKQKLKNSRKF